MIRKYVMAPLSGLALALAVPAYAQEEDSAEPSPAELEQFMGMLGGLFQAEPLTAEQESRLPAATAVVAMMMPEGFYGEMMGDMMDKMMRPMMAMFSSPDFLLASRIAAGEDALSAMGDAEKAELLAMLDPAYDRRVDVIIGTLTANMADMFVVLEPPMREGLSKAYAVRFDGAQLRDIAGFFATPTGGQFARESMALFADPQVMQATMQALPQMMGSIGNMESAMKEAMESLPAERGLDDLSDAEKARMAQLLRVKIAELDDIVQPPKSMAGDTPEED